MLTNLKFNIMASIKNIKPGQTLYDVSRETEPFGSKAKYRWWPVYVKEVNVEEEYIIASWNGNPEQKMRKHSYSKLRLSLPK